MKEDILWLEITMDDLISVKVLEAFDNLSKIPSTITLTQSLILLRMHINGKSSLMITVLI
jgi:hypothetical protein